MTPNHIIRMIRKRRRFARLVAVLATLAGILVLHEAPKSAVSQVGDARTATASAFIETLTDQERSWLREHPVIRVFQDASWPPIEFADAHGEPSGMSEDYVRLIEQLLGVTFERVKGLSWEEGYARLKRWEIDMTTAVTETPERERFWAFTKPYMRMPVPIVIVTRHDVNYVGDMRELAGKPVAVVAGYAVTEWIPRDYPAIQLVPVSTVDEGLERLQRGEVIAFVENMLVVDHYIARAGLQTLKVTGQTPYQNAPRLAVRKDWSILAGILDKALSAIPDTERYAIYRRWLPLQDVRDFDYRLLGQALGVGGLVVFGLALWIRQLRQEIRRRQTAEQALLASEERFRLFMDHSPTIAWVKDEAGRHVYLSRAYERRFNVRLDAWRGKTDMELWPTEIAAQFRKTDMAVLTGDRPVEVVEEKRNPDGSPSYWLNSKFPFRDAAGDRYVAGIGLDITLRRQSEERMREERDTREAILQSMTDGLMMATPDGRVLDINPAAMRLHGFVDRSEALQALADYPGIFEVRDLGGQEQPPQTWPLMRACLGEMFTGHELWVRRRDTGQVFIGNYSGSAVRDAEGRVRFGLITIRDVSAQKRAQNQIRQLAFYDSLTGLPNRRLLEERLAGALTHATRHAACVAVMVLDLDYFKAINDALGHSVGDALLVEVARRMSTCVRSSDTVARPGGDEFMLILPGVDADGAAHLAEKLVERLSVPFRLNEHELTVGCSLGISLSPEDGVSASELIARADTAMYRAKQAGRNRYQFFTEDMQQEALRIMQIEHQLRQALGGEGLCLHYQPQVDLASGRPVGLEALVRWVHPTQGLLGPDRFVPLAERSGLIVDLGAWVLQAATTQLLAWKSAGLPLLPVAVNLSAQQFRHPERRKALSCQVSELLAETGLDPRLLELEITENSLLEEAEETLSTLQALRRLGVRLTLDDFGTGYSSLGTLSAFPVDRLKIDQSFVRAAPTHAKQAAIIETILALGRHLHFEVIAEGVETTVHLDHLRRQGCALAQGYYFSKPLPAESAESWLRRSS